MEHRAAWAMVAIGGAIIVGAAVTGSRVPIAAAPGLAFVVSVAVIAVRRPARWWAWVLLAPIPSAMIAITQLDVAAGGEIRGIINYSSLALGLLLIGGRTRRRDVADTLDAGIVASGTFLLMWLFLLAGKLSTDGERPITALIRPFVVAVLAGLLTRLLLIVEARTPSFWLLTVGAASALIGAVATTGLQIGYSIAGSVVPSSFAASSVLITAALLHPSSRSPFPERGGGPSRLSRARAVLFALLTLLGPFAWIMAVVPSPFKPQSVRDFGLPVMVAALISLLLLWRLALITRLAEAAQAELAFRATHDPLTGLGNRAELTNRLDNLVKGANRPGCLALLSLDLDGFKHINDSFGHPVGDELLIQVGGRLSELSPSNSTVARLGGDEFSILLPDADERSAIAFAETIRSQLSKPYKTTRGDLSIAASVGIRVAPRPQMGVSEMLRDADLALYAAKAAGKNRIQLFDHTLAPRQ